MLANDRLWLYQGQIANDTLEVHGNCIPGFNDEVILNTTKTIFV